MRLSRTLAVGSWLLAAMPAWAVTVDRVAARIDQQVLTVSEINQMVQIRFFPTSDPQKILVSNEDIEAMYKGTWSQQRRQRGLPIPPLTEVIEEIRTLIRSRQLQTEIDKWTAQLRARANVDVYAWR